MILLFETVTSRLIEPTGRNGSIRALNKVRNANNQMSPEKKKKKNELPTGTADGTAD